MKNQLWGYVRPCHSRGKYLLLGVITATALLWSMAVVPAAASAPVRLSDSGVVSGTPQNDGTKRLALSLPFAVDSHWTSVGDNTPGIIWATPPVFTSLQKLHLASPILPLSRGGVGGDEIKFGIQNGQFTAGNPETDTWFIYGWFGALRAIKQPYNVKYPEWGDRHNGIDFAGVEGIEVASSSAGKVTFAGKKIGNTVIINAGNGYQITYGHLQDIIVKKGDKVETGDLLGHLGHTGTTNPHLHFQIDLIKKGNRTAINPVSLFDAEWGNVIIPVAEANQFYTEDQNPLSQPNFLW